MNSKEFKQKAVNISRQKTVYMLGTYGQLVTNALIDAKAKQLPKWYTPSRIAALRKLVGKGYHAYDCVGLIKGILWNGKYASNGVPDTNADGIIKLCKNVSTDMSNIKVGEVIWFKGHIGIMGTSKCIESAPSINKVGITELLYQGKWCKHGELPWIEYDNEAIELQQLLNELGYDLVVDGIVGPKTKNAVADLKQKYNRIIELSK